VLRKTMEHLARGRPPSRTVAIACSPDTLAAPLTSVLAAALAHGFDRPYFLFLRPATGDRPLLGRFAYHRKSAASVTLVGKVADAPPDASILLPPRDGTCADLAARAVELRRAGKEVALVVGG
jgi:hypothetical protein